MTRKYLSTALLCFVVALCFSCSLAAQSIVTGGIAGTVTDPSGAVITGAKLDLKKIPKDEYKSLLKDLNAQMDMAAANLQFEQAAELRDLIAQIKQQS